MVLNPKSPVTVREDVLLADALSRMIDRGVGAVLVTDADEKLVGILTERDVVARSAAQGFDRRPVRDIMTPRPETLEHSETLAVAVRKMNAGNYRHLPITRDGTPVGVISVRDLLRHVVKLCI
jgi:CBS domain-containing protein